ncbi:MAG: DASS family sodium-coupled anion symporter [archaeon]
MGGFSRWTMMGLAILLGGLAYLFPTSLPHSAQVVLAIGVVSMVLWVTEALPLHVTALLAGVLLILAGGSKPETVFASYFDSVVVLVFGGFVLALAMSRHKLDEYFSQKLIRKFGNTPGMVLLGILVVTAAVSLWISNSAAAALSMPIVLLILRKNKRIPGKSIFGKGMVLAVAYGATIGGMGTLIGSTPNVLAQKFLTNAGIEFGFLEWGVRAFPFALLMVFAAWGVLLLLYPPEIRRVKINSHGLPFTREQKMVGGIFLLTVVLWVTESVHGIPSSVVALFPVILLSAFRLILPDDFNRVGWDTLLLIGGGIALGVGIESSGLSGAFASQLGGFFSTQAWWVILLFLGALGVLLTSFLSNTAASAVLIPIVTSLSVVLGGDATHLVVTAALGVSLDFMFPMGTPPTAIAYSTKYVPMREMVVSGLVLSIIGVVLLTLLSFFIW